MVPLSGPEATAGLATALAPRLRPGDAVLLSGPLGAGKTTFARALLRALAGDPGLEVPSPSYTLLQTYDTPAGPVAHFDLWRVDGAGAMTELGWEEARAGIVLVEWPDRLATLAPGDALAIEFSVRDGDCREATLSGWPEGRLAGLRAAAA